MKSMVTSADMKLKGKIFPFASFEELPISFVYGGSKINGLPAEFSPVCETRIVDSTVIQRIIRGRDERGLEIRVEHTEYRDFPAIETVAFFTNTAAEDTPVISDICAVDGVIPIENAALIHGNGDTLKADGYEWFRDDMDHSVVKAPADGTACNGAFPYMRLQNDGFGVNIAVGWPHMWKAEFSPAEGGVHVKAGQLRCNMVIRPGETMRTPRMTFLAYEGDETRGTNMWRRWYFAHILPRENGEPLPPKFCAHVFGAGGHPEFTGATEGNQVGGIEDYVRRGLKPDIWWVDAGWYPCDYDWPRIGTWLPDEKRFPNGLAPIGKKCEEHGIQFLLWFEPERVRQGTKLANEHSEWLLKRKVSADGDPKDTILNLDHHDSLLNLGDRACCDALIEHVDGIIKTSGVRIYRQDFNFDPKPYWEQNEAPDRIGALENLHVQGYLRYWDELILRNPGLWMDSCASGGRRNDLETMRRAVPLHYTDVGYGNHPIKLKQHHQMFGWIPYFRAHNMNWDDPMTGEYGTSGKPNDRYSYYVAMTPALTDMIEHDAPEEEFVLARQMHPIWRRAAGYMLNADYYPLTANNVTSEDCYAVQFYDPDRGEGYLEIVSGTKCENPLFTAKLRALDAEAEYLFENPETGEKKVFAGKELTGGVEFKTEKRTGQIWFYSKK